MRDKKYIAEQGVIAAILLDSNCLQIAIEEGLHSSDFTQINFKKLWLGSIKVLDANEEYSSFTIAQASDLPLQTVLSIEDSIGSTMMFKTHLRHILDCSRVQKQFELGRQIVAAAKDESKPISERIFLIGQKAEQALEVASEVKAPSREEILEKINSEFKDRIEGKIEQGTIKFGIPSLDQKLGLIANGELVYIAARPSVGKSALAVMMANANVRNGKQTMFVCLENSLSEFYYRFVGQYTGISTTCIRQGGMMQDQEVRFKSELEGLKNLPLYVYDDHHKLEQIEARARILHKQGKLDCLIVDYLQLVEPPADTKKSIREQQVSTMSRRFKKLAQNLNIPVIVMAQLNRGNEVQDREPVMSDLRESGSLEQDANRIILIHRPKETMNGNEQDQTTQDQEIKIIQAKNRNGKTGFVRVRFIPSITTFKDEDYGLIKLKNKSY